jgi:cytochrome c553
MKPTALFLLAILAAVPSVSAQQAPRPPLPDMQAVAAALGVTCDYCHAPRGTEPRVTANGKPRLEVGREMIAMTASLNASVQAATGKTVREAAAVTCATCHRGVAIPRPLTEILLITGVREGADAAAKQYRELRAQHFGRAAYDFGENTLLTVVNRLAQARPEVAIPLADLNLEFFPKSVTTLVAKAIAQSGRNDEAAVATLKQALEIDPENGEIKGRLYQIEEVLARRKRFATPN